MKNLATLTLILCFFGSLIFCFNSLFISPPPVHALDCSSILLTLTSPVPYQTYQRLPNKADIKITGTISDQNGSFQAIYRGITTTLSPVSYQGSHFTATLPDQPQGQGSLVLNWSGDGCSKSISIPYVGVGDIFLIAGQSNHKSVGLNHHTYSHPTLKATSLSFNDNNLWKELQDPVDDAKGASKGGTYFPLLATKIMTLTGVPVAFIPSAVGGTSIARWERKATNHFDPDTLYGFATYRAKLQNGIRAILWWQGESDVIKNTPTTEYKQRLITLANNFSQDLGTSIPLIAYQIGQSPSGNSAPRMRIVQAIRDAASASPKIILGPDLGDVPLYVNPTTQKKNIHFITDAQQQIVADRVFVILKNTLYKNTPKPDKPGDINLDGRIDSIDASIIIAKFRNPYTDIDYAIMLSNFGK